MLAVNFVHPMIGERESMRSEKEMFDLILAVAREDERIRAVYMNGSRTNANVPRDIFQDYDIVYAVTEMKLFYEDKKWIDCFGKRLYMQCPDEMDAKRGCPVDYDLCYGWLIQFSDGNRLDLHVEPVSHCGIRKDKLCKLLLDKDGKFGDILESTDRDYWVKKPSEGEFVAVCNEYWWCLNNVAKGLWRNEIPYVQDILNETIRPQLVKILSWQVGIQTDFTVSVGKSGKYMYRWLSEDIWERFLKTYCNGVRKEIWESVFVMCDLFHQCAMYVGCELGFAYNMAEEQGSRKYLERVYALPHDAKEIF